MEMRTFGKDKIFFGCGRLNGKTLIQLQSALEEAKAGQKVLIITKDKTVELKAVTCCKDCKHKEKDGISEGFHYCNVNGLQVTDDWFCADGEPIDEAPTDTQTDDKPCIQFGGYVEINDKTKLEPID